MGVGTTIGPAAVGAIAQLLSLYWASMMTAFVALVGATWYALAAEETLPRKAVEMI